MPLIDKKIPGWLKGAVAGTLLLTVGHFIHQTFFVGWREYQVLVFTDLPFGANEARYDIFLDGNYREKTFFVKPAPDSTFQSLRRRTISLDGASRKLGTRSASDQHSASDLPVCRRRRS